MKTKIALVLVALFCCGSSCCPDLPGGVARRHFTGQKIGSINTQGANDGVDSRPDKGGNGSSQCGLWTQYRDSSDAPVEIGGVRVDICTTYYFPSGGIIQESRKKVYTYPNGYAFWYVGGSTPSSGSYQVDFISRTNGARSNASIGGMFRRVCPSWTDDVGYKECYPPFGSAPYPVQGEYYGSGSQNGEGNLAFDINGNRTGLPSFLPSSAEQSFLDAEPNHFDNVP
ncbi:MAG: hypothetical protein IMZ61_15235, partial [Planctomycetes bacterium]|nr:hypothetical protein [Planctomycetota bacterium]